MLLYKKRDISLFRKYLLEFTHHLSQLSLEACSLSELEMEQK